VSGATTRRVLADVPAAWRDAVRAAAPRGMSQYVADAVAEMLASGELCIAPPLNGDVVDMAVYLPGHIYDELQRLVERGVYASVSEAVRGAIARRLGLCRRVVPHPPVSARSGAAWGPCNSVDFNDWGKTVELVKCVLRRLLLAARGRVVTFNLRKLCGVVTGWHKGNCVHVVYSTSVYAAVEEAAGDCVVARRRRAVVLNVECLRERLCGGGCL